MMPNMPQSHSEQVRSRGRKRVEENRPSASKRGYGRTWQKFRLLILHRDPICKICGEKPSTDVDHIVPKAQGGKDTEENCQGACHECHSEKTTKESKPSILTTIIAGPPGAGKTTYVQRHMKHGDLLVDFDMIYRAISGLDLYDKPGNLLQFAVAARDGIYYRLCHLWSKTAKPRHVWIIAMLPKAEDRASLSQKLRASVVVLETSPNDCEYRLQNDTERGMSEAQIEIQRTVIVKWWKEYTEGEGEKKIVL